MKTELAELLYCRGRREGMKQTHNYEGGMRVCVEVPLSNMCVGGEQYVRVGLYTCQCGFVRVCV